MVKEISKELLEKVYRGGFLHCRDIHDHTCNYNAWLKFKSVFDQAYKYYIPIHCIPVLLFKRK